MKLKSLKSLSKEHNGNKINKIKLRKILSLIESTSLQKQIKTFFPPVEIGSITLVDQIVLLTIDELLRPNIFLEIGTFKGYTTRLMLNNSYASMIYSIDLPKNNHINKIQFNQEKVSKDGDYNDQYLRYIYSISNQIYLSNLPENALSRLKLIECDSRKLDFRHEIGLIDLAFIDGGHTYEIIKSDTENVMNNMKEGVIIWHDYSSDTHSDVTKYLQSISDKLKIFHIIGSLCAFTIVLDE